MKRIQQYCSVVDRLTQNPACKQEVLARASRSKISVSRRGMITGTAVAAVLLALNIGGGSYLLKKSAEESMTVTSETPEELVTALVSATTAPGTDLTAVVTKAVTDHSAVTKTVTNRQTNTVTTSYQTVQTGTTVPAKTTARQPETTIARVTDTTVRTTVTTAAVTAVQTTTETTKPDAAAGTPESGKAQRAVFGIIPSAHDYLAATDSGISNNVCHVSPGETLVLSWMVWNDPGITCVDLRVITTLPLEITDYNPYSGYAPFDAFSFRMNGSALQVANNGSEKEPAKKEALICYFQVKAPEQKGTYSITLDPENDNTAFADPERKTPVSYDFCGIDIIVDKDGTGAETTPRQYNWGDIRITAETVEAHPGDKNVPVNIYVEKSIGFAGARLFLSPASGFTLSPEQSIMNSQETYCVKLDIGDLFSDMTATYDSDTNQATLVMSTHDGSDTAQVGKLCTLYVDISEEAKPGEALKIWIVPYEIVGSDLMPRNQFCESVPGEIKIVSKAKPMCIPDDLPVYRF